MNQPQFIAYQTGSDGSDGYFQIYEFDHVEESKDVPIAGPLVAVKENFVYRKYQPLAMTIYKEEVAVGIAKELNECFQKETPEGAEFGEGEKGC